MVLEGRMKIGLGEVSGIAGLREEGEVRKFEVSNDPGHPVDGRAVCAPLNMGMGKHQAHQQQADTQQAETEPGLPDGKPGLCPFLPGARFNQGF